MPVSNSAIQAAFAASRLVGQLPESLRNYALRSCLAAAPHLETIPDVFAEYTDHGVAHSCKVLILGDKLLANQELTKWEALIFILSAFYHDIGMSCTPDEWDSLAGAPSFQREYRCLRELALPFAQLIDNSSESIERQVRVEYLRRHHGERSQNWITRELPPENPHSLVESIYVWEIISWICIGHTLDASDLQGDVYARSYPIGIAESVDVRFLACLLRLADICHLSRDRALPFIRQTIKFNSCLSEKIWAAEGEVAGVDCDENRAVISVAAQPRSFELHRIISNLIAGIEIELQNVHRLLAEPGKYQLPWKSVDARGVRSHPSANYIFEPNARFRLVQDKIVHLLMGSKLYADPLYALRECLQNSIDAVRLYRLRDRSVAGRIVVQHRVCPEGAIVLEIFDNGTGMDRAICLKHLLSVGSDSFAFSERRYKDWGAPSGNLQLIAQHGIGFLSCFMLGDKVEVFSKYPEAQRVHLILDSPTWIGEFKTTDESQFPRWSLATFPESNPWEERHGTCVRLHLKKTISKFDLMHFLSRNVLRTGERIIIIHGEDSVELVDVWGTNNAWSDASREEVSLAKLRDELFSQKVRQGGIEGPPRDPSLKDVLNSEGDIRGIVRLSERYESSRLSQEGFLLREGVASLFGIESGVRQQEREFPFYFDLDVRRKRCFELDAERARITDPQGVLTAELLAWIEEKGLLSVEAIETSFFFVCGGPYYHGGSDLLVSDDTRVVAFHEALRRWYSPERMRRILSEGRIDSFVKAKLFATIGKTHNTPVSIADMLKDQFFVMVPRVSLLTEGFDVDLAELSEKKEKEISYFASETILSGLPYPVNSDRIIILPNFPKSFSLPLSIVFRFEWLEFSPGWALLGRLVEKETWDVPQQDLNPLGVPPALPGWQ